MPEKPAPVDEPAFYDAEPAVDDEDYPAEPFDNDPDFDVPNLRDERFDELDELEEFDEPATAELSAQRERDFTSNLADDPFAELRDDTAFDEAPLSAPVAPQQALPSAVLAIQLGAQEQLRRLPRTRLMELLQRYRDCLDQAASLYQGELHTLSDGSSLMLFHQLDCGEDYLTHAICCGELMRALGHALQIEVADSGITLQLQLGLTLGENLSGLTQGDLLLSETAQSALALSQHSRNLLLVERSIADDALVSQRARIRAIASPQGACCVERLLEPYPSLLERQLARMHENH